MIHTLRSCAWSATLLLFGCMSNREATSSDRSVWTAAESAAVLLCQDSLRAQSPGGECRAPLADGLFSASIGSAGQITLARYWHVTAYQLDSAFISQQRRVTKVLGPPTDTVRSSHVIWNLDGSSVSLWQRGPDVSPVDSSQLLWAVVLIDGRNH